MSSAVFCKQCKVLVEYPDGMYANTKDVTVLARCPKCNKVLAFSWAHGVHMGPGAHEGWTKATEEAEECKTRSA